MIFSGVKDKKEKKKKKNMFRIVSNKNTTGNYFYLRKITDDLKYKERETLNSPDVIKSINKRKLMIAETKYVFKIAHGV